MILIYGGASVELKGLTKSEVEKRILDGQVNTFDNTHTKTIKEIILSNIFTYFNILNVILAASISVSGIIFNRFLYSLKNLIANGNIIFSRDQINRFNRVYRAYMINPKSNVIFDQMSADKAVSRFIHSE